MGAKKGNFVEIDENRTAYVRWRRSARAEQGGVLYEHIVDPETGETIAFNQVILDEEGNQIWCHEKYPRNKEYSLIN